MSITKSDITDRMRLAIHRAPALRQPNTPIPAPRTPTTATITPKTPHGSAPAPVKPALVKPARAKSMNRTEREYFGMLKAQFPTAEIGWEKYILRMADRCTYSPDFSLCFPDGRLEFHEVKGGYIFPKALVKLRIAAELFGHDFYLAQKRPKSGWHVEKLPKRV